MTNLYPLQNCELHQIINLRAKKLSKNDKMKIKVGELYIAGAF